MTPEIAAEADKASFELSCTVLLVDDDEIIRFMTEEMCSMLGIAVISATDGVEALGLYRQHHERIDAVVLDLKMPRMDGEETFRELKKINGNVQVILASGYPECESADRFAGNGVAGFLQKPYRLAELSDKLEKLTGRTFPRC